MTPSRTYHHGDLRAALIRTATDLARSEGPAGVVVREAARQIGVSHNAAYRHFSSREELLTEVGRAAQGELAEAMRTALRTESRRSARRDAAARARSRLTALGRTYVEFAVTEPGLFRVAFGVVPPKSDSAQPGPDGDELLGPHSAEPFMLLLSVLEELVEADVLDRQRLEGAAMACWSAVHGFATLVLDGPLRALPADQRDHALAAVLDELDRAL